MSMIPLNTVKFSDDSCSVDKDEIILVQIIGPYISGEETIIRKNIARAREAAIRLYKAGFGVITPHLNTAGFEEHIADQEIFLKTYKKVMDIVDIFYVLNGWENSDGSLGEIAKAIKTGKCLFFEGDLTLEGAKKLWTVSQQGT